VLPGDYDLDGDVDAQDYDSWRSDYGIQGYTDADGNRDSRIDTADYVIWRDSTPTSDMASQASNTPEPTSTALGLSPLLSLAFSRAITARRYRSTRPRR
jgi:hypothetical protein